MSSKSTAVKNDGERTTHRQKASFGSHVTQSVHRK